MQKTLDRVNNSSVTVPLLFKSHRVTSEVYNEVLNIETSMVKTLVVAKIRY